MAITKNQNEKLYKYKVRSMLQLADRFKNEKGINEGTSKPLLRAFLDVFFMEVVFPDQIIRGVDIVIGFVWNLYSIHPYAMAAIIDFMMENDQFEEDVNFLFANKSTGGVGAASGLESRMLVLAKRYTQGKNYYTKQSVADLPDNYTMVFDQSSKSTITTIGQTKTKRIILGVPIDADKGVTQADNVSGSLVDILDRFIRSYSYAWLLSKGKKELADKMVAAGLAKENDNKGRRGGPQTSIKMFNKFTFNIAQEWTANIQLRIPNRPDVGIFTNKYNGTSINKVTASIQRFAYYSGTNNQTWGQLMANTANLKQAGNAKTRAQVTTALAKMNATNNRLVSSFPEGFPLSAKQASRQDTLQEAMLKTITDLNLMFYAHALTATDVDTVRYATGDRAAASICMLLHSIDRTPAIINGRGGKGFPYIFESTRTDVFVSTYPYVSRRNKGTVRNLPNIIKGIDGQFTIARPDLTPQVPLRRRVNVARAEGNVNRYAAELNAVLGKIRSVVPRTRMNNSTYIQLLGQYEQLRNNTAKRDLILKYINSPKR